jgi:hypothetical protein
MSNGGTAAVTGPAIQVGTLDVVTGNYIFNPFDFFSSIGVDATVLMNDGHGGLVAAAGSPILVSLTQGQGVKVGVSLGDMNGDGKLDIVAADPNGNVAVFLGDGHGGFTAGPIVAAGLFPWALALADLNGDGRLDIVTGNVGSNTLSVVLADGLGGYAAPISIPAGIQPVSLALGDVNGDGTVDIIAGNANSGGGSGSVTVALNDGHGGFLTATVPVVQDLLSVALGDLNGDGRLDLVVSGGQSTGTVDVLLNDGSGVFTRVPGTPFAVGALPGSVALGDLNGDGLLDIVVANIIDSNVSVLLGDGAGGFAAQTLVALGALPSSMALADVNGDGFIDILTTNYGGTVSVALNDGHGGFGAAATITTTPINPLGLAEQPMSLAFGNLDNVQTTAEDTDLVFNAAHDNAIRVSDLGANGASETLTLTVLHGTLTLATTSNLSIVANAGNSSIQITGTLADINAALDGLIYRPDQDYNGADTLTLDLNDNGNNGAAAQSTSVLVPIDVTAVNDAPVLSNAIPDQSVAEDTAWSFQFPANAFTDPEGDAITFTATLGNGDQLPAWLSFDAAARTFSGTPPTDFNGPIDLKVSASDGALARSDTFTLTVTPVNDAPVLSNAIPDQSVAEDTAWSFQFAANAFTDPDGDAIAFTATLGNGDLLPAWLSFNAATRTFSGTPPANFNGPIDLKVTASDGSLSDSGTFTLTVTPVNDAPALSNAIADQSVAEDTAWSFQFAANAFTDPDGDAIAFTATLGNGDPLPAWLSFNAATRTFSGVPPTDFNGAIDLKVMASDGTLATSDTFTLAVTPVNDAPVVSIQGTPDVVVAGDLVDFLFRSSGIGVGVGLNDGAGGLAAAAGSPLSVSSTAAFFEFNVGVALGDLDRDGRLDIVVTDATNFAVHVLLGDGHGGFSAGPVVAAGAAPWTVALGDLDHDGRLDIVTGNLGDDTLSVMLADGLGGFSAPASIVAGSQPVSLALGDVNRDGYLDILAANHNGGGGPGSVTVALNDGHGGFSTTTTVPVVQAPITIALGDLNRDGILDLVVASGLTAGSVDVLLGDGLGGFTRVPGAPFATGAATYSVALGDINGDGILDIVAGNSIDGNLSLFLGDGAGGFTAQAPLGLGGAAPNAVALQDVNGDGSPDLVTLNAGQTVGVALNDGHGGFGAFTATPIVAGARAAANFFALGNLDNAQTVVEDTGLVFNAAHHNAITLSDPDANGGDETLTLSVLHGALTLAAVNNLSIVSSAGGATLRVTGTLADINTALDGVIYRPDQDYNGADVLALDLNDNGNSGGAALTASALVPIDVTPVNDAPLLADLTNASYRPHGTPVTLSPALTLSDVDSATLIGATVHIAGGTFAGDGDVLAASVAGTAIAASYNAATETLTLSGTDTLAHYQQVLASVTFESTGANPSDTGAHPTRTVTWQVNDGSATDNLSNVETTTIDIGRSLASSFGNTGHSGILWQNADGTPAIWLLNGTTLDSGANVGFNPGPSWHAIGSGDFNGDGNADILWQNADGTPAVWLMNGTSILSGQNVGFNPGAAWHVIGTGDFDGDGKADILWQNNSGQAAVWLMDGQTMKSGSDVGPNPGASWHVIGSGDFNGDGKADILWQNQNGQAAVWLMDGRNLLSGANVGFNPGSDWHVQAAGDFNGDGKADILWQNTNGQAAVWMMDGQNLISGNNVGFNPGPAWQVHGTGDFNGDGKADIQWQNTDGTPAVWLMDGYNLVAGSNVGFDPGPNWHVVPPHHDALV